jgi:hypothetical protein
MRFRCAITARHTEVLALKYLAGFHCGHSDAVTRCISENPGKIPRYIPPPQLSHKELGGDSSSCATSGATLAGKLGHEF